MLHLFRFSKRLDQGFLMPQHFRYELWVSPAGKSALMGTHCKTDNWLLAETGAICVILSPMYQEI